MGGDGGALATALCLCVCAAGLFVEDQLQRGLRRDQRVLAYVGSHPKATMSDISLALGLPGRKAEASLARLTEQALVSCVDRDAAVPTYTISG
ncbi:MarR family transcriptional regulator [Streptomyces sp. A1547]|nr:MarR family transcriptional regulator [Streptomyces sp. A1547]